jgi:hypothetical protein
MELKGKVKEEGTVGVPGNLLSTAVKMMDLGIAGWSAFSKSFIGMSSYSFVLCQLGAALVLKQARITVHAKTRNTFVNI